MSPFETIFYSKTCSPPPFTKIVCPLTHSEIGEAKYNIAPAISSALPKRFIGVCANITFSISGVKTLYKAAVRVAPGPTALIRTSGPKSCAKLATV